MSKQQQQKKQQQPPVEKKRDTSYRFRSPLFFGGPSSPNQSRGRRRRGDGSGPSTQKSQLVSGRRARLGRRIIVEKFQLYSTKEHIGGYSGGGGPEETTSASTLDDGDDDDYDNVFRSENNKNYNDKRKGKGSSHAAFCGFPDDGIRVSKGYEGDGIRVTRVC